MARAEDRHPLGPAGDWFVDTHCIDCGASRHVASGLIERNPSDGVSLFLRQPTTDREVEMAWRAAMVCPTRSVGHVRDKRPARPVFPQALGDGVWRLGHNARSSFGAHSYLIRREPGNIMIDAPRWTREVTRPVEDLGGIAHILLSHQDDVADADKYAEHFGASVWIHHDDRSAAPYATNIIEGTEPVTVADQATAIPVPGHTKGSVLYLVDDHLLFSGDSLAWDPHGEQLIAFRDACWYSWAAQTASLATFAESPLRFDRLFCGHGWSHDLDADRFHHALTELVQRMPTQ